MKGKVYPSRTQASRKRIQLEAQPIEVETCKQECRGDSIQKSVGQSKPSEQHNSTSSEVHHQLQGGGGGSRELVQVCNQKLILEYRYPLTTCSTNWVCVGMNVNDNYEIAFKLVNGKSNIILITEAEINGIFISQNMIINFFEGLSDIESHDIEQIRLRFNTADSTKFISLEKNGVSVYFGRESFYNFLGLQNNIWYIVSLLRSLDFGKYFKELLCTALTHPGDIFVNLIQLANATYDLAGVAVREIIAYYPNEVSGIYEGAT